MIETIICMLIGHKKMHIYDFENGVSVESDLWEKLKHIYFCERCKVCFWD